MSFIIKGLQHFLHESCNFSPAISNGFLDLLLFFSVNSFI